MRHDADLIEIGLRVATADLRAAERLLVEIEERCRLLRHFPFMGRRRPDIAPDARSVVVGRYSIFYRVREQVDIVRIVDGRRDLSGLRWPEP